MQGLREKQKASRRKRVIEVAMTMFLERGYDAVKLEEIAAEAEISAGTAYAYFKTKNDLLLAVTVDDFENSFETGKAVIAGPISDACDAINRLTYCHFREAKGGLSREMWRTAVSVFLRNPNSPFSKEYDACLLKMRKQYIKLLKRLRTEGYLPRSVAAGELAELLFNNANMIFLEFIRDDAAFVEDFFRRLNASTANIVQWVQRPEITPDN